MINTTDDEIETVLFLRIGLEEDIFCNEFSVASPGSSQLNSRAFVKHIGPDTGVGTWICSKDSSPTCTHINRARNQLQKLVPSNWNVLDGRDVPAVLFPGMYKSALQYV